MEDYRVISSSHVTNLVLATEYCTVAGICYRLACSVAVIQGPGSW